MFAGLNAMLPCPHSPDQPCHSNSWLQSLCSINYINLNHPEDIPFTVKNHATTYQPATSHQMVSHLPPTVSTKQPPPTNCQDQTATSLQLSGPNSHLPPTVRTKQPPPTNCQDQTATSLQLSGPNSHLPPTVRTKQPPPTKW